MIPRAHFRCSVFPVRMKNVKNDARGNGVSSWVAVDQASECSRGKRPLPSGPCRVGGRGTGAKPSWGPGAAWMTSSIGNPARRRTSCRESVYRNPKNGVFGSLVIQEGFILIEAALSRENWLFPGKNQPRRAAPAAAARRARGSPSLLFQFRDDSGIDFGNFENNRRHSCLSGGRARAAVRFSGSVHCGQQPLKGFGVIDGINRADPSLRGGREPDAAIH